MRAQGRVKVQLLSDSMRCVKQTRRERERERQRERERERQRETEREREREREREGERERERAPITVGGPTGRGGLTDPLCPGEEERVLTCLSSDYVEEERDYICLHCRTNAVTFFPLCALCIACFVSGPWLG